MPKISSELARAKETEALQMLKAGHTYEQIAKQVGYASPSGAHDAVARTLKRHTVADIADIREVEIGRLDDALGAVYPRVLEGDDKAIDSMLKIMHRRALYLGLDHKDALLERQTAVLESQVREFVGILQAMFSDTRLAMNAKQKAALPEVMRDHMIAIETELKDVTSE